MYGNPLPPFSWKRFSSFRPSMCVVMLTYGTTCFVNSLNSGVLKAPPSTCLQKGHGA